VLVSPGSAAQTESCRAQAAAALEELQRFERPTVAFAADPRWGGGAWRTEAAPFDACYLLDASDLDGRRGNRPGSWTRSPSGWLRGRRWA